METQPNQTEVYNMTILLRYRDFITRNYKAEKRVRASLHNADNLKYLTIQIRIDYAFNRRTGQKEAVVDITFPNVDKIFSLTNPTDPQSRPYRTDSDLRQVVETMYQNLGKGRFTYHNPTGIVLTDTEFTEFVDWVYKSLLSQTNRAAR